MKQVFGLLTGLIFLLLRLRESTDTSGVQGASTDPTQVFAPIQKVFESATSDLMTAALISGVITLALAALISRWR